MLHLKNRRCRYVEINYILHVVCFACIIFMSTGCESTIAVPEKPGYSATVSGRVTLNGKPVNGGEVGFFSLQFGMAGQAELDKDGKFTLADPIAPGDYRIYFLSGNGQPLNGMPTKYMSETSSDFTVSVKESDNQLTIDLKS